MNTNPRLESCLLTHQGCRLIRQVRLAARYRRIVTAHLQLSPGARRSLLTTCHGNVDVIVEADRHHQGIEEVVAIWPPTDDAQIHVDFCWGEALHGPHTLTLSPPVTRSGRSVSIARYCIVCLLADRYTSYHSPCKVSCGKMNRSTFSPDPPILWQQTVGARWISSRWGMALGRPPSCTGCATMPAR